MELGMVQRERNQRNQPRNQMRDSKQATHGHLRSQPPHAVRLVFPLPQDGPSGSPLPCEDAGRARKRNAPQAVEAPAEEQGNADSEHRDASLATEYHQCKVHEVMQLTDPGKSKLLVYDGELLGRKVILIDSGASAQFISTSLVTELGLTAEKKIHKDQVQLADGHKIDSTHLVRAPFTIVEFSDEDNFHVLPLTSYDLILGRPWLDRHNPDVDWPASRMRITKGSRHYELVPASKEIPSTSNSCLMLNAVEFVRDVDQGDQVLLVMLRPTDERTAVKTEAEKPEPNALRSFNRN
jgi:hypothetical protein